MKDAVKVFTFLVILFILASSVAGMLAPPLSTVVTVASVLLAAWLGYSVSLKLKRAREEAAGLAETGADILLPTKRAILSPMPLVMPVIAVVFLISYLTALLFSLFGMQSSSVEIAPLPEMLILHALLPAIVEETVFRYLPMKLIAPYSRRWCAVLSAVYFALVHMSVFQIPYALAAGFIFILIDLAYDSVWPSFILHILNNAVSVLWIKYSPNPAFALWFVIILVSSALLSLVGAYFKKKEYSLGLKYALDEGEPLREYYSPMLLIGFTVIMLLINTFQ